MDEPTSALDPASTMRIEELMSELKKTIPWSLSPTICSRPPVSATSARFFLVGELVECAPTQQIFSMPADKRTEDYITGRFG